MPSSNLGRTAVRLLLLFLVAVGTFIALVASGQRGGATLISNPWLATSSMVAVASAVAGGVAAFWAIFGRRERSPLVMLAALVGTIVAVWVALEIAFPH